MTDIQTIRTASGEELVVMTRADYDALLNAAAWNEDDEDTADVALYDQRKAALAAGEDHVLTEAASRSILAGERAKAVPRELPGGRIEVSAERPAGQISDAFNLLKRTGGPSLSIDEINAITAKGWAGKL